MTAYYNEIDPFAAQWLRELIKAGHIAPGDVDERSIEDITPNEIKDYTQCHFFAGIGVWSYALRQAGWPDNRPVWTGSCPCQPFSAAGKGGGFTDERHLWPAWFHLVTQCRPAQIFGEQVASKDGLTWFDLVQTDMEGAGYAGGAVDLCAAGFGAPHIRQRLWLAYSLSTGRAEGRTGAGERQATRSRSVSGLAYTESNRQQGESLRGEKGLSKNGVAENNGANQYGNASPTNGFWRAADWLRCRDDKWRPVEPGTFPLVDGASARVGRLRGYGNALNAEVAKAFIEAYMYENNI